MTTNRCEAARQPNRDVTDARVDMELSANETTREILARVMCSACERVEPIVAGEETFYAYPEIDDIPQIKRAIAATIEHAERSHRLSSEEITARAVARELRPTLDRIENAIEDTNDALSRHAADAADAARRVPRFGWRRR